MTRALILLLATSAYLAPKSAQAQDMEARARAAADASRSRTSDSEALTDNYLNPGLSGEAISTVDGRQSFAVNLACQKSAKMLELLVQPGATGDITHLSLSRDSNLDGSFDEHLTLPVPVSGICANGIVSCDPGSWNNCTPFQWDVGSTGGVKLTQVPLTDLSACYCVNASCGSNLVLGNLSSVLKDLGGGIIGALTTADPRIGVAQASIEGPIIRYVGAQTSACTASAQLPATSYRADPTTISGDAAASAQGSSVFQAVAGSAWATGKAEVTRSCSIDREIIVKSWDFDDILGVAGAVTSVTSCGPGCHRYQIRGAGSCGAVPPIYTATFDPAVPSRIVSARIVEIGADDWVQARVNGQIAGYAGKRPWLGEALPSGDCRISDDPWYNRTPIDVTTHLRVGAMTLGARVRGAGNGNWGYVTLEVQIDTACQVSEHLLDLCAGYAQDSACRLDSETVDGVATFANGVNTGLKPLAQTRLYGSGSCTFQYSRDFFERDRRYKCAVDSGVLSPPDLSRSAYIIDHSTETLLADRTVLSDGTIVNSTRAFALPDRGSVPACEPICKTRAPRANSYVALSGVVGAQQNDPSGWNSFYHSCTADNVCPLADGEELVSACGCLDDFPEAAIMMQTVRLAGSDLACTAGTP